MPPPRRARGKLIVGRIRGSCEGRARLDGDAQVRGGTAADGMGSGASGGVSGGAVVAKGIRATKLRRWGANGIHLLRFVGGVSVGDKLGKVHINDVEIEAPNHH